MRPTARWIPLLKTALLTSTAISLALAAPRVSTAGAPASAPSAAGAPGAKAEASAKGAARGGSMVKVKSGAESIDAYLAAPRSAGEHSGVIVIQEWWGLNDQIRTVADDLAAKGYVALAPDLYRGKVTADPNVANELLRSLPDTRALGDLAAAYAYLRAQASVGGKPIGSIGFCMGGRLSLRIAMQEPSLAASVVCYGRLETDPASLKSIHAPVLGIFGGADRGIPVEMIDGFRKAMEAAARSVEIKIYPEAGHGFMNPNNPSHRTDDTKDAWARIDAFFAKHLH